MEAVNDDSLVRLETHRPTHWLRLWFGARSVFTQWTAWTL